VLQGPIWEVISLVEVSHYQCQLKKMKNELSSIEIIICRDTRKWSDDYCTRTRTGLLVGQNININEKTMDVGVSLFPTF